MTVLQAVYHWVLWNAPIVVLPLTSFAFFFLGRMTTERTPCPRCTKLDAWQKQLDEEIKKEKGRVR